MQRWPGLVAVYALLLCAASPRAADGPLEPFYGDWQGVDLEVHAAATELEPTADDLDVAIRPDGDGFHVRWTTFQRGGRDGMARQAYEARFGATERPGVFAFAQKPGSLFGRLFAAPATGNPLEGETLLWARLQDGTLILYSLGLTEQGGFDLNRHAWTPGDDGMSVTYTRRTEEGEVTRIAGRLGPGER